MKNIKFLKKKNNYKFNPKTLYKKQQKERRRQADKAKKRIQKEKQTQQANLDDENSVDTSVETTSNHASKLPWLLLIISWIGFAIYLMK